MSLDSPKNSNISPGCIVPEMKLVTSGFDFMAEVRRGLPRFCSAIQFRATGVARRVKTSICAAGPGFIQMTVKSAWVLIVPLLLLLMVVPAFAVTPYSVATLNPKGGGRGVLMGASSNWSGYLITAQNGSVTDVRGTWVVPAIQGSCPTAYGTSSSF
jgi:hypothetical protein